MYAATRFAVLLLLASCADPDPAALLDVSPEPVGSNCAEGGSRIDAGPDDDGDGELDAAEIETTTYVCNGSDGADGQDGADGSNGTNGQNGQNGEDGEDGHSVLIDVAAEPAGGNCTFGGHKVTTGVDDDDDGVLDAGEVDDTTYVCDGEGQPGIAGFRRIAAFTRTGGPIAEIVAASPDGRTLAYTSSVDGMVGFIDITAPAAPADLGTVDVSGTVGHPGGEPTSVAITPDGSFALVAVKDTADPVGSADPGALVFIDMTTRTIAGSVSVGVGPDCVHITPDGAKAVIAIEDEENPDGNSVAQARPGSIQVVTLDYVTPASSTVATIALAPSSGNMPTDPQPEFIDITADGSTAIVSLQENNLLAVIDLGSNTVVRYIDAGVSIHARADLTNNGTIDFSNPAFVGQLQPDSVCLLSDGVHFLTANEGDTANFAFGAGIYGGGRGFSVFRTDGDRVYDSGDAAEWFALRAGAYAENRSGNRGIEIEGCATGVFGGAEYGFLLGERDAALIVLDLSDPTAPVPRQLLAAPMRPEGIVVIPDRDLVIVGGEGNGTGGGVWIYQAVADPTDTGHGAGVYDAHSAATPFSALGALTYDAATGQLLATPDNAFAGQRIWSFWIDHGNHRMELASEMLLRDVSGTPLTGYDPEGIAINPDGGYVIASEGTAGNGAGGPCTGTKSSNRLLFFDAGGRLDPAYGTGGIVDLPCGAQPNAIDWTKVTSNGFEGIAMVGRVVYVAFQRALTGEGQTTRIGAYDVDTGTWSFWFYSLEPNPGGPAGNTFLSELLHVGGDKFAVIERDQGWAGAAGNKTIRTFRLSTGTADTIGDPVAKATASDLLGLPYRLDPEKVEGLALGGGNLWVTNDNDGGQSANLFVRLDPAVLDVEGAAVVTPGQDDIIVSEVNSATDVVELFNQGVATVDLSGWKLTETDAGHVHVFPGATSLAAGGYLAVSFALDAADLVAVKTPLDAPVDQYSWTSEVASASLCPALGVGSAFWAPTPPTPGAANDCTPPAAAGQDDVVINEVNSSGTDFIELYNTGISTVDLSGWKLTDNTPGDPTHVFILPPGTTIGAGARVLFNTLPFGLGSADAAALYTPFDVVADQHSWTSHVASAGRCPEGSGGFTTMSPTPGAANACP